MSPLLANIALSTLDEHFIRQWQQTMNTWHQRDRRRKHGLGSWKLVRYAGDFVLCVNGRRDHAEALRGDVAQVLAPLGLHLARRVSVAVTRYRYRGTRITTPWTITHPATG